MLGFRLKKGKEMLKKRRVIFIYHHDLCISCKVITKEYNFGQPIQKSKKHFFIKQSF